MSDNIDRKEFYDVIQKLTEDNKKDRHDSNNKIQEMVLRLEGKIDSYIETIWPIKTSIALHEEKHFNISKEIEWIKAILNVLTWFKNDVNIKIAWITGAWAVAMFVAQFILSKWVW